uniref:NADH dehydrogenase subunit 6 n=2 Tax=Anterhynchium TaxID=329989 RepID=A0A6M9ATX1_9HYME|nr:NADH dehydrogenase subunit 6 [Anterhynchium aff. flavomarginatum HB]QKK69282.1 NADH dehydrogenase subunit 6 [Anterhynchium aff. flavomarginatum SC]
MNKSIMLFFTLLMISSMISMIIILIIYPYLSILMMLIMMIFYSLFIALNLTKFSSTSLMSYLTFLAFTGGIMILFTFFLSLISNTIIYNKFFIMYILITSISLFILLLFMWNKQFKLIHEFFMNLNYLPYINNFELNNFSKLNQLYSNPKNFLIIFIMIYLLFSLILLTKLISMNSKPMRRMN